MVSNIVHSLNSLRKKACFSLFPVRKRWRSGEGRGVDMEESGPKL
jgi:hypothetical protein